MAVCSEEEKNGNMWDKGPVGLHNIGQTCCLNSLIQDLDQYLPFHFGVLQPGHFAVDPGPSSSALHLSVIVGQSGERVFVQHDAAQLYLTVWNLIKDQITDVDLVERLQALYTIQVKESLVCLECTVEKSRNSSMLTLPLPLFDMDSKPLKTLEDALRCFFQPRELSGKSKCFCEKCGKKTCGKQVLKLTHLPQTLTIHLLRFSIRNSQTEKICHSLDFPQSLDLSQVLIEEDLCNAEEQVRSP
ncbi:hypothetical protein GH733_014672 [Mirounga leonina]|nr:hypothetical protein GH733_014672 [Mirounga leonina]